MTIPIISAKTGRFLSIVGLILFLTPNTGAQVAKNTPSFYDVSEAWHIRNKGKSPADIPNYKRFKRWEWFYGCRSYPAGHMPAPTILWSEWQSRQFKENLNHLEWQLTGPDVVPENGGGAGRANCMALDPDNPEIIWLGTPNGGLWKSPDGGDTWENMSGVLPNLGVSAIAIHPQFPDTIYIATGDGYGLVMSDLNDFWGGTYSAGVLRSTDGGKTWRATGLNYLENENQLVFRLAMHPATPRVLLATTPSGVWKSTNGAENWHRVLSGPNFKGLRYLPADSSVVFATDEKRVWRSTNAGESWEVALVLDGLQGTTTLATSSSKPNSMFLCTDVEYDFAQDIYNVIYKSPDRGESWERIVPDLISGGGGWYMSGFAVSPVNPNHFIIGGVSATGSSEGDTNWGERGDNLGWPGPEYTHADHRQFVFHPQSDSIIFDVNDGGLFKSTDGGFTWQDLSNGLSIAQFYDVGITEDDNSIAFLGAQDNGVVRLSEDAFSMRVLADGMRSIFQPGNPNRVVALIQAGITMISDNMGDDFTPIGTPGGAWITPISTIPGDTSHFLYGGKELYKVRYDGQSIKTVSSFMLGGENLTSIAVHPERPDTICVSTGSLYFGTEVNVFLTTDGGITWDNVTSGLPVDKAFVNQVKIDPVSSRIYAVFSGYAKGQKVFYSDDLGLSWNNFSDDLPNIPVNCIALFPQGNGSDVYIGTDFGVYARKVGMDNWGYASKGLPPVIVSDIEINRSERKIYAATYGRSLWTADITGITAGVQSHKSTAFSVSPNPTEGIVTIRGDRALLNGASVQVFDIMGREVTEPVEYIHNEYTIRLDLSQLKRGTYLVRLSNNQWVAQQQVITR